ncbi:MAG: hypothetical protein R2941_18400 [Desulfobacterales bacterium]
MKIWLEEKIGDPNLFTGRRRELEDLLGWTEKVKKKLSPSRALLSRRKTGKTALLQRLYNRIFEADDGVILFYYEVKEENCRRLISVRIFCKIHSRSILPLPQGISNI